MRARRLAYPGSRWVRHIGIKNVLALADANIAIVDALEASRLAQGHIVTAAGRRPQYARNDREGRNSFFSDALGARRDVQEESYLFPISR